VAKSVTYDLRAMSKRELEDLVRECTRREQTMRHGAAKARRTWTALRADALAELDRRFPES
jgi:hypothetical protein